MGDEKEDLQNTLEDNIKYVVQLEYKMRDTNILYTGYVKNGVPNGKGQAFCKNDLVYDGEFLNGLYHGEGIVYNYYTLPEINDYYKGHFVNGYLHGEIVGYWQSTNKKYLEVNYNEGDMYGMATYYYINGVKRATGMKNRGDFVGDWKFYHADGKIYGRMQHIRGSLYRGIFYQDDEKIDGIFDIILTYRTIFTSDIKSYIKYGVITNQAGHKYEIIFDYLLQMETDIITCRIDNYINIKTAIDGWLQNQRDIYDILEYMLNDRQYIALIDNEWKPVNVYSYNTPFMLWTIEELEMLFF